MLLPLIPRALKKTASCLLGSLNVIKDIDHGKILHELDVIDNKNNKENCN